MTDAMLLPVLLATLAIGHPQLAWCRIVAWPWAALRWRMAAAKAAPLGARQDGR